MATVGATIQKLQHYDPNDTIEDLLEKPDAVAGIRESLKSLPKTSRIAPSKIVRNRKPPSKQKSKSDKALNAILSVSNIELPPDIQEKYDECRQSPSLFWDWAGIQPDPETNSTKSITAFLCRVYLGITSLRTQHQWDTISWRFFVIFFHDLVATFGGKYLTSTFEDNLVLILSSSPLIADTDETIKGNLRRWVACGSRYALLSRSFDNGASFLLPQSVTDKTWETGFPLSGPLHERAIKHLLIEGICRKSKAIGADVLGTEIREAIIKPFRWGILTFERNAITNPSHTVLQEQGGLCVCPNPTTEQSLIISSPLQTVWSQEENRASIDFVYQTAVQANTNEQPSGQDQSNIPNPCHDHSTSARLGITCEQTHPDPTGAWNSAFDQLMANQNAGGYQESRNFWDSAANQTGQPRNFSSGGCFSLLSQNTPVDFWNAVYIPPQSDSAGLQQ